MAGLVTSGADGAPKAAPAGGGRATVAPFGTMPDGTPVQAVTLANHALSVTVLTFGATVQAVRVPDRAGTVADVVLGYDDLAGYLAGGDFLGATVGRVANRIARGHFMLDGRAVQLPINNPPNSLHGGADGFSRRVWTLVATSGGARPGAVLRLVSPDGDEGFPGALTVTATFRLDDGALSVSYRATTTRPTIVNLSSHGYWALAGEGAATGAMGTRLFSPATGFLPVDATAIPLGEVRPVADTPFDFRHGAVLGDRAREGGDQQLQLGHGFDHMMVVGHARVPQPRPIARLEDPASGRVLEVLSDQPGFQLYTGNFLKGGTPAKNGHLYRQGDGIAIEPQMFPDAPNHPGFAPIRLAPGEVYRSRILFRFSIAR